jgi:2-C-methyl-D-erythritol 2,4-cyclodiphosphate synthase
MSIRVGHGYDIHAFGPGDHVTLGGQRIPYGRGVVAHSDGDVLIHALCDAILGALGLGDIGHHFPPGDPQWKDADSRQFLRHVAALATARGWRLGNADLTLIAEAPKLGPHVAAIRANLAADLGAEPDRIGLKATTHERLGSLGRGEGIAAHAVVLIEQIC